MLNFGVSGYCTRAEIELLETKGLAFDPDVVVVVFVENDFDNFNTQLTDLAVRAPDSALAGWLFHRSSLVQSQTSTRLRRKSSRWAAGLMHARSPVPNTSSQL